MKNSKEELLSKLSDCVVNMEDEHVIDIAKEYIASGYSAIDGINNGIVDGMQRASTLYDKEEYFIPELLVCSEAMYNGLDILKSNLESNSFGNNKKVVIGVVEGDTHDIGKNLVKILLEADGFNVIDLGKDVACEKFIESAIAEKADIIALSTLMSSTMANMEKVINLLEDNNLRQNVKVIIGGAPVSLSFSNKIKADGYSANAVEAVKLANRLLR